MTTDTKRVVVTGAGGFLGGYVARALLADERFAGASFTLVDVVRPHGEFDDRVEVIEADLSDPAVAGRVFDRRVDVLAHLAGILGGAAERDYDLARKVNLDTTLSIFERLSDAERPPRIVYASSVAVYGDMPALVTDDAPTHPRSTYGAQKLQMEIALEQFSASGLLDGLALRLPGVMARPGADSRLGSAFLNNIFYAVADGEDFVMPVSADAASWLISVRAAADAFVHAASLDPEALGRRRAFLLPLLSVRIEDLVTALQRRFPESPSRVSYKPDPAAAMFAHHPPAETALADSLGFVSDGSLDRLVERSICELDQPVSQYPKKSPGQR